MRLLIASFLAVMLLVPIAQAMPDTYYFTMQNDSIECLDLIIPDDFGIIIPGKTRYEIEMKPISWETWSDLSEWIVETDENETVKYPICFDTTGRTEGQCGANFTLTINAPDYPDLPERVITGGVCVSKYRDVDTGTSSPSQSSGDAVNSNSDVISIGLKDSVQQAAPGESKTYVLQIQSYAELNLEISVQGPADPALGSLSTGPSNPYQEFTFTASSDDTGTHDIWVNVKSSRCTKDFCTKQAGGKLVVQDLPIQEAGFTVSMFPQSINVRDFNPVEFRLTIQNNGPDAQFSALASLPSDLSTTFIPQSFTILQGQEYEIPFTVTPGDVSGFYEIYLTVNSDGDEKGVSSYLSTNELFTDALREAEWITQDADADIQQDVNSALDDFYSSYRESSYGQEEESYSQLKDSLSEAKAKKDAQSQVTPPDTGEPSTQPPVQQPLEIPLWMYFIPVLVVVGVLAAYFLLKGRKTRIETASPSGLKLEPL